MITFIHPRAAEGIVQTTDPVVYIAAMVQGPDPEDGAERLLPALNCRNEAIKSALG